MINLDDPKVYEASDAHKKVVASIDAFSKQLEQAWKESSAIAFPEKYKQIKNVVACGMGGSRFTPLIVKELFKEELTVPYTINDDYTLPGFVGPETLVILSTYSGTTEEVLACAKAAKAKGALLTGVTLGGELAEFLQAEGAPFYQFNPIHNPSEQPRIGLGYMTAGHIGIAYATGLLKVQAQTVEEAITTLPKLTEKYTIGTLKQENAPKKLAEAIYSKYPYLVTAEFLQGFGNAFGNAINETGKNISSPRIIPEINHHLMEGLQFPVEFKQIALFIFFFSKLYHERVQKRFTITREVVERNSIATYWHELKGATKVEQLFESLALGSYVTLYLAILYNQDPTAIPWVDLFKKKLKE